MSKRVTDTSGERASRPLVGGIELGGTKLIAAVATGPDDLRAELRIPTTTPAATMSAALAFFTEHADRAPLAALGIASFGPLDLDPGSPTFGSVTTTPKPVWADADLVGVFRALGVPIALDTDVNGAALAEHRWGVGRGFDPFVYLTVGTGIGAGAVVNGRLVHGLVHPEVGHIRLPHDRAADPFPGACVYHGDCLEGLASGPAIERRWGAPADTLPPEHPAWELEAQYLALALVALVGILSPRRIVVGGGVVTAPHVLARVRTRLLTLLGGYVPALSIARDVDAYVVRPALGDRAGVLGAIALAQDAVRQSG